jgi:hypothetical protein
LGVDQWGLEAQVFDVGAGDKLLDAPNDDPACKAAKCSLTVTPLDGDAGRHALHAETPLSVGADQFNRLGLDRFRNALGELVR